MEKIIANLAMFSSLLMMSCRLGTTCCDPTPAPVITTKTTTTISNNNTPSTPTAPVTTELRLKPDSAAGKDVYITQGYYGANLNYDKKPYITAQAWTYSGTLQTFRSLIDFDLSAVPAGAVISKATMTLYVDTISKYFGITAALPTGHFNDSVTYGPNNWNIRRITSAWDEKTVSWNTQPTADNVHIINMSSSTSRKQNYTIDVTDFIKDEFANPTLYHGFLLKLVDENYYKCIVFCSSDGPDSSLYPELNITYTK